MMRIAIGLHEIVQVLSRRQALFLRLACCSFKRVQEGDRLWLAEPFYIEERFNDRAPTAARDLGGKPAFVGDHPYPPLGYGSRHPASAMCRDWHRSQLLITSRTEMRLQDLTAIDLAALGFEHPYMFARHWDRESALSARRTSRWCDNPTVLRFGFELIRQPLPASAKVPSASREKRGAKRQPPPRADLVGPTQNFAHRYQQARHLSATAKNPIDLAPRPVRRVALDPAPTLTPLPLAPKPTEEPRVPAFESPLLPQASFTTGKGDKAFLAAFESERPGAHQSARSSTGLVHRQTIAAPIAATGACPRCGSRLAYGCEHYPASTVGDAA